MLREVLPSMLSGNISIENIETQVGKVPTANVTDLIALMMTDQNWTEELEVGIRDKGARYDGIVQVGPIVLTIENKPCSDNIWKDQISPALDKDSGIRVHSPGVVIYWPDVIKTLGVLISRGFLGPCANELIKDFLAFVQEQFPLLNPYDTLVICGEESALIDLRLKGVMAEIAPISRTVHRTLKHCIAFKKGPVRQLFLRYHPESKTVGLAMMPGDTMVQARELYPSVNIDRFLALSRKGWDIRANLHFSHIQRHYYWGKAEIDLKRYMTYWQGHLQEIVQVDRDPKKHFAPYFHQLLSLKMIDREDFKELDRIFTQKNRNHIRLCPGIDMIYYWSLEEAARLDERGKLAEQAKEKILEAFETWGQPFKPDVMD